MVTRLAPKLTVAEPACIQHPFNTPIRDVANNRAVASSVLASSVAVVQSVAVENVAAENAVDVDVRSRRAQIVIRDQR